jgi:hypothetical protein
MSVEYKKKLLYLLIPHKNLPIVRRQLAMFIHEIFYHFLWLFTFFALEWSAFTICKEKNDLADLY